MRRTVVTVGTHLIGAVLSLVLVCAFCGKGLLAADEPAGEINALVESGGLLVTLDGRPLLAARPDDRFVPASTIKIATALIALDVLGPDYRFRTDFLLRPDGALCIRGGGDPFLTSERVQAISGELRNRGLLRVTGLVLDDSLFAVADPADGSENSTRAYDAPNGALAVNFNALPLHKHDTGRIDSPEPHVPVLPITRRIGALLKPGTDRVNVAAFPTEGELDNPLRYAGELFAAALTRQGIAVTGTIVRGRATDDDRLLYRHVSPKPLAEMVRACLKHSNNFLANQLFLTAGAERYGYPATWAKAQKTAHDILVNRHRLPATGFQLVEGSGLSRRTQVTPVFMIALLEVFKPHADLLGDLHGIPLKSGTMRDIYCYGGYFPDGERLDPFVILLNQPANTRRDLLGLLHRQYREAVTAHRPQGIRTAAAHP